MTTMRRKATGAGMVVLLGLGGVVALATGSGAQGTVDEPAAEAPPADRDRDRVIEDLDESDGCDWFEEDLSDEELAELRAEVQAEADAVVAALDAAGVEYELVDDGELGVAFPEPVGDDEAAWAAFDAALAELWAEEFASLPADEQAEIVEMEQAFATELRAALDEAGITYELETDAVTGVEHPIVDGDDDAVWEVFDRIEEDLDSFDDFDDLDDEDDLEEHEAA